MLHPIWWTTPNNLSPAEKVDLHIKKKYTFIKELAAKNCKPYSKYLNIKKEIKIIKNHNYILGVHDGHNCGATVVFDGRVLCSVLEAAITRRKNEVGYPKAIEECLKF